MLDSIYIGMTGLLGYSRGLRVIANNTANINTPGFKSASQQFSDYFYSGGSAGGRTDGPLGHGLNANGTVLSFDPGDLRQTGNELDMAVDGAGLFTLKDAGGRISYTRAGQFQFNTAGVLVHRGSDASVMGQDASGNLVEISVAGARTSPGKATTTIKFNGNLSSTATEQTVSGIKVMDKVGGEHTLSMKLTSTNATLANSWKVELLDGTRVVGTGQLVFAGGAPTAASAKLAMNYTPAGMEALPLTLDFSSDVSSFASASLSTLAMSTQDGFAASGLAKAVFDAAGTLVLTYANGQSVKGARLALARFDSVEAVEPVGDNQFEAKDQSAWHRGLAGNDAFGSVRSGVVEISNVDLSQEFSDLVVMQRGYQASSQVVSTANDMLQELFSMKGK